MIKLFYNDTFKNYILLMGTLFLEEIIFRLCIGLSIIDMAMIRIFVGVNIISLILSMIYSFFGRIASNIITFITGFLFSLYAVMQVIFKNLLGSFISITMIGQFNNVKDYIFEFFGAFRIVYLFLFIPIILLGLFYLFLDYKIEVSEKNEEIDFSDKFDSVERKERNALALAKKRKRNFFITKGNAIIVSIIFIGVYAAILLFPNLKNIFENKIQYKTNLELFLHPDMPDLVMEEFGYTGYIVADLKDAIKPIETAEIKLYANGASKLEQVNSDYIRRFDDTLWEKIIDRERDEHDKIIGNYLLSQEITDKNDFTGFFKNKNLIMIAMPSINNVAINKEYFPNIYLMYKKGWSFENNYTLNSVCNGIDNEISALNSIYPIGNACNGVKYANRVYPYSLYNLFNNAGYKTTTYHNYTEQFYNRKLVHGGLGSLEYLGVQNLGIPYTNQHGEWPSDMQLMEKVLKNIKNEEKFMIFITPTSTNYPYNISSEIGNKNLEEFADTNYDISFKRYLSKIKEFDNALGLLINGLEEYDKMDDTVIVLYSTGSPKGLDSKELNNYLDYDVNVENNIDKSPFIIYNTEMQGQVFKQYTSIVNITPTIANLFDLSYDPRLYMGKDLMAKSYVNRVIFSDGSWKDSNTYFNAVTGKITYNDLSKAYSDDELKNIINKVGEKIMMSSNAIKYDYFNHLEQAKESLKAEEINEKEE